MDSYFVITLFICYISPLTTGSIIVVGPKDTDSIVGGNIILYCTVSGLGSNTVVWKRHQTSIEYSHNRTIVASTLFQPDRYRVTGDDDEGTYNLEITGIIRELDEVPYQCILNTENGDFINGSKAARLRVHDEPKPPTCNVEPLDILEGNNVDFECVFDSRISEVEMNLTSNYNSLFSAVLNPNLDAGRSTSSASFVATAEDNGAVLRCSVDQQIFNMPYYCSVTLNVKYKPVVEIKQEGTLSDGNASFTCGAMSNPNSTHYSWSLCLGASDMECIDPGNGTLTIEQVDSDGFVSECCVFGSNVSCQVFENGETELPIYVVLNHDNLTFPDNMTVTQCVLKCSVMNTIGVGNDNYTIDDAICLMEIAPTTIMATTPLPTTVVSTTTLLLSSTSTTVETKKTTKLTPRSSSKTPVKTNISPWVKISTDKLVTGTSNDDVDDESLSEWEFFLVVSVPCVVLCIFMFIVWKNLQPQTTRDPKPRVVNAKDNIAQIKDVDTADYVNVPNSSPVLIGEGVDVTDATAYMELTPIENQ